MPLPKAEASQQLDLGSYINQSNLTLFLWHFQLGQTPQTAGQ